ncbi:MAG TPA: hypothetical protein VL527_03575 [Dongiaceae bacterium]|nr:hypothetical protein [Dongiaceae bacterium]
MREIKIFCPKCQWEPRPLDRWMCYPGCKHLWNTFDTCGVCPLCGKNWEDTMCPACHRWSRHAEWYHELTPAKQREELADGPPVPATGL